MISTSTPISFVLPPPPQGDGSVLDLDSAKWNCSGPACTVTDTIAPDTEVGFFSYYYWIK